MNNEVTVDRVQILTSEMVLFRGWGFTVFGLFFQTGLITVYRKQKIFSPSFVYKCEVFLARLMSTTDLQK